MSKWAQAKQVIDLDWRTAWREIAQGTHGYLDPETLQEALVFMDELDCAYRKNDKKAFLETRIRLEKHRLWSGSRLSSAVPHSPISGTSTAAPISQDSLTLWDATEGGSLP